MGRNNNTIEYACDIIGGIASAGMAVNSDNIETTFIAASSAPIISTGLKEIVKGVFHSNSSPSELKRLSIYTETAKQVFERNCAEGKTVVNRLFLEKKIENGYDIEEVIENFLKTVKDDTIKFKSKIYGHFLGNIPFRGDLDASNILFIKDLIANLSFTELCIIEVMCRCNFPRLSNIQSLINSENAPIFFEIYNAIIKLKSISLLVVCPPFSLGDSIGNLNISKMGAFLCEIADLHDINQECKDATESLLSEIDKANVDNPYAQFHN